MGDYFLIKMALIFLGSLTFSVLINRIFLKFSKNLGIRDLDEGMIRWSSAKKPSFGGIAFYIIFLLGISSYQIAFPLQSSPFNFELVGLIIATSIGFLVGLADDAFNTNPVLKILAQMLCAAVLISSGTVIEVFDYHWANILFSTLWVIGLMNSINMLDNMDAVTTLASIFTLICFLIVLVFQSSFSSIYFLITVGLIGALLGFLFFNWHPSKMYMGDTGSQFLGVLLAALSIKLLWNYQAGDQNFNVRQFILP